MKKAIVVFLCILAAASALCSQDWKGQGRLTGIVADEKGNPLEGVRVKFFCPKYSGGFEVTTGKDGRFTGAWLRSALWNIEFQKLGYMPLQKSTSINQFAKNPDLNVVLKKVEGLFITEEMKKDLTAANDLYDKKDYDGAVAAYKAFLAKYPDAYVIWTNVGNCYFVRENYDEAEKAYNEVLAKEPSNVQANISIGNCYANRASGIRGDSREELEKHDAAENKALEWYGKVPIEKIDDSASLISIGQAFKVAQKPDDALKYFRKAVEIDPNNADSLYELGLTYTSLQNKAEAIAAFENYLKVDPDSERAAQVKGFLDYLRK